MLAKAEVVWKYGDHFNLPLLWWSFAPFLPNRQHTPAFCDFSCAIVGVLKQIFVTTQKRRPRWSLESELQAADSRLALTQSNELLKVRTIALHCLIQEFVGNLSQDSSKYSKSNRLTTYSSRQRHVAEVRTSSTPFSRLHLSPADVLEAIKPAAQAYADNYVTTFKAMDIAPLLLKWGHGTAMATVLFAMGGTGTFLGWQIRNGNGGERYWVTLGKTAREQHPLIMGLAFLNFFIGGSGGLVLTAVQDKPILESPHAVTALIGMSLMIVQAMTPLLFKGNGKAARSFHAYLGSALMLVLVVHLVNGISLGMSI